MTFQTWRDRFGLLDLDDIKTESPSNQVRHQMTVSFFRSHRSLELLS
jgi:hypothetical protein